MSQMYQQYWSDQMEVKENIMKMNISRKQYKRLLRHINDKEYSLSSVFSVFNLNKKQFMKIAENIDESDKLFGLLFSQEKFKKDKDILIYLIKNFYRIEKPIFEEGISGIILSKLEVLVNQISYFYAYKIEEKEADEIIQIIREIFPFNIANTFITIFLEKYSTNTLSKEFVKKYKRYFSPKFLANCYQQNIDDSVMTQELMNAIKDNISDFIKFSFGEYSEHFIKINIGIDIDQIMLRNTLGDDERKIESIDPTLMFNFYAMKQGEKEE